jgi:hypothetical protein
MLILILYPFLLFVSCNHSEQQKFDQGVVQVKRIIYDNSNFSNNNIVVNYKIWFWGTTTIQEVPELNFFEDTSGKRITTTRILHYSYINPTDRIYVDYSNFSDTSAQKKAHISIDSIKEGGAWDFYSSVPFQYSKISRITDSIIDGINYNRLRIDKRNNNNTDIYLLLYTRCDKKGVIISNLKNLSDSIGCPILRTETYNLSDGRITSSLLIDYTSNSLSPKEIQVFEAWKK